MNTDTHQNSDGSSKLALVPGSAPWSENQAKKHEKLPDELRRTMAKWREIIDDRKESMRLCPEHSKAYRAEIETLTGCIKDVESLLPNTAVRHAEDGL